MNHLWSRRSLIFSAIDAARAARYETPYKYGKLVLRASSEINAFDNRSVDCPFVFSNEGRFYMTYIGFDGTGYQTGLASSKDLVEWKKLGCILRRDAASPITRFNIAMNWIVRENALASPGKLRKIRGRFLGVFHAYPNAGYESGPAVIGLCSSDDLMRWDMGNVVLRPEDGAEWERGGLYKPCLVEDNGTFYLFYNAKNYEKRWRERTGVASVHRLEQLDSLSGESSYCERRLWKLGRDASRAIRRCLRTERRGYSTTTVSTRKGRLATYWRLVRIRFTRRKSTRY